MDYREPRVENRDKERRAYSRVSNNLTFTSCRNVSCGEFMRELRIVKSFQREVFKMHGQLAIQCDPDNDSTRNINFCSPTHLCLADKRQRALSEYVALPLFLRSN